MLIVVKININETYKKISFLCLQALEVEAYNFSKNYCNEK